MNAWDKAYFRNFMMRAPRPARVQVIAGEDVRDIDIGEGTIWADLAETVAALDPDRLELFDREGQLLRADKRKSPARGAGVTLPAALHQDPNAALLMLFANLLHRAYEHSTGVAFDKFVEILSLQTEISRDANRRLERLEARHAETLRENLELSAGMPTEEPDPLSRLAEGFLGGMNAGKEAS